MADADASNCSAAESHLIIEEQSHALSDVLRPVCAPCADKHSAHGLAWFVWLPFVASKVDGDRLILGDELDGGHGDRARPGDQVVGVELLGFSERWFFDRSMLIS